MKFRILTGITGITSALALCAGTASADSTVRFWYHFDNADNPMDALIEEFEEANPDINVEADNIPWNSYYDQLYTSIIGSNAPDAAMVKMFAQPRLIEMGALAPIDDWLAAWEGTADLQDNLLDLVILTANSITCLCNTWCPTFTTVLICSPNLGSRCQLPVKNFARRPRR
ncbi:hypothetical protein HORIV_69120 [Vreelandella olivaria]|uniref:Uncharacterized protein n=1 Tax=Vreelandella olivaria TaxID=390919 RepID=A0ABM7GUH6_9GAMM|nr:hypothetical protein HORIV_69120 [Halomonas olivaria]